MTGILEINNSFPDIENLGKSHKLKMQIKYPYSVWIRENTDKRKFFTRTFYMHRFASRVWLDFSN